MNTYYMNAPLAKEELGKLRIGDIVYLTGYIHTARDAAHFRFANTVKQGGTLPMDFTNETIFYAGPTPAKPGRAVGAIAPTTSLRIDGFVEMMFQLGMSAMIGKGERSDYVADLCRQYGGVYFLSIGGASALISKDVKSVEVIAYEDLGTESIKKLYIENMRLVVGIDTYGDVFQHRERALYQR